MQIPSGSTDRQIYFVAVDVTDLKTREVGLTGFTVYRSRNGATATAYTTPTVTELDATNMSGVYSLLVDEDTTLSSGHDTEEYCVHIAQASMSPVTRAVELYRPKFTEGQAAAMASNAISTVTAVTNAQADSSGVTTLLARIIGTLAAGTHTPQTDATVLAAIALIQAVTDKLDTTLEEEEEFSEIYRYTTDALVQAPSGGVDVTLAAIAALNNLSATQVKDKVDLALADVNLDHLVGTAALIPAIPTGTYIDQLMDGGQKYPTFTVVDDAANTAQTFKTNLTAASNDTWTDVWATFKTGALAGQTKRVTDFVASTDFLSVHAPYTAEPADGDTGILVNR